MGKKPFFVTCGRGMNYFVVKELHNISGVTGIESEEGKVFFDYELGALQAFNIESLTNMKSAERLFLNAFQGGKPFNHAIDMLFEETSEWTTKYNALWKRLKDAGRNLPEEENNSPAAKKLKLACSSEQIQFRINFKCTGKSAKFRSSNKLVYKLGKKLHDNLNWVADLKNPQIEIYLHWNDKLLLVGFPLTKLPLSKRPYLKTISLRTTVCWAMAYCADIKPGDVVFDPMCGAGVLLIEIVKCWPVNFVIGNDIDSLQLKSAVNNCVHASVTQNVQLLQCSVDLLPLKNEFVDAVLCDFPFGLQHGTYDYVTSLLPKALKEIDRVCKTSGKIVVLISQQMSTYLLEEIQRLFPRPKQQSCHISWWKCASKNEIKLGALPAAIYSFHKRSPLKT